MNWDQIYSEMAFSPYKGNLEETMKLRDALTTLHAFLEWQTSDRALNLAWLVCLA